MLSERQIAGIVFFVIFRSLQGADFLLPVTHLNNPPCWIGLILTNKWRIGIISLKTDKIYICNYFNIYCRKNQYHKCRDYKTAAVVSDKGTANDHIHKILLFFSNQCRDFEPTPVEIRNRTNKPGTRVANTPDESLKTKTKAPSDSFDNRIRAVSDDSYFVMVRMMWVRIPPGQFSDP